ncbi:methylated-DNA--[protein]-cysteine S-methyltransferase [Neobacillus fumarioli]|uniref:methylated-DNA--[protein]-cysteine S-methyltransferase n=1 Tax=Neobacillus fumarioli TaxID=105229 RepID=UPI00082CC413|nr:methylated-DNA--[protein]-cysteine S-methyltransferase [Neobacillus fumarioli]
MNQTVYWSLLNVGHWNIYLAATAKGLCYVGSQNKDFAELAEWVTKKLPDYRLEKNDENLQPYAEQYIEYFRGERKDFSFPVDFHGTPFQRSVWHMLMEIPYGKTYSYSEVAEKLQIPNSVRAVAGAIGANPILISIPCHRVVGKNGKLTGFRGGLEMKEQLLRLEKSSFLI